MKLTTLHFLLIYITATIIFSCSSGEKNQTENTEKEEAKITENEEKKRIMFFGNSITAGYELKEDEAFPALIQRKLDSLGYEYITINAGLSGETTTAGRNRIDWVLKGASPDIFVLELGGNDGLRGLSLEQTELNLQYIINTVKQFNDKAIIIIAGMQVPPNLGNDYVNQFKNIFPRLAKKNDAILIPFLLENVAGNPELNLKDGIHPTAEGHKILAETVWKYLQPHLIKAELL